MNKSKENNDGITKIMKKNGFRDIGTSKYNEGRGEEALDHIFVNDKYFEKRGVALPGTEGGPYLTDLQGTPGVPAAGTGNYNCQAGQRGGMKKPASSAIEMEVGSDGDVSTPK